MALVPLAKQRTRGLPHPGPGGRRNGGEVVVPKDARYGINRGVGGGPAGPGPVSLVGGFGRYPLRAQCRRHARRQKLVEGRVADLAVAAQQGLMDLEGVLGGAVAPAGRERAQFGEDVIGADGQQRRVPFDQGP